MGGVGLNPSALLSGQGMNVATTVQQIIAEQSGPLTEWQSENTALATQAGLLLGINNNLTNLATAMQPLTNPTGPLAAVGATTSDPTILTATAQTTAVAGTHNITVTNLSSQSFAYTDPVVDGTIGAGSLSIQVGSGTASIVPLTANETLAQVATYINTNNLGVTANVVNDANGSRLSVLSNTAGQPGTLTVVATGSGSTPSPLTFTQVAGVNASLTVDGIPISSASNTITGVIPGVTLNLLSAPPGSPMQLTVGADSTQALAAVNNFISAYNTLIGIINQQYTVDPLTNTEGPLRSDVSLRSLQSSLLSDAAFSASGNSGLVNLESLGINTNSDGTLTVGLNAQNQTPAQVLAANPAAFQNFFQNTAGTGFADSFGKDLSNLTDPTQGALTVDIARNSAVQQVNTTNINNFEAQMTAEQTQLTAQFDTVNASLQAYPILLQETTELIGSMSISATTGQSSTPTLTSGL
jgi:flagellar hook-associated protein 2